MSKLVVSLSSIPPRFAELAPTLNSLVNQSADIAGVYLYVPESYRRFPEWDGSLPDVPAGVEVRRCAEDWGPATKILGAAHLDPDGHIRQAAVHSGNRR